MVNLGLLPNLRRTTFAKLAPIGVVMLLEAKPLKLSATFERKAGRVYQTC